MIIIVCKQQRVQIFGGLISTFDVHYLASKITIVLYPKFHVSS